ncbi:MAG: peptide-binding protein [Cellvibrionaceae bacterium]|nr:peptide-binding protein [Cellvibrionaceae bacterium]
MLVLQYLSENYVKKFLSSWFITTGALASVALPLLSLAPAPASAEEYRWVSDVLYVPLRSGKGNKFRILDRGLKTGTRLEFISQDDEGGWTEVKSEKGEVGYIRSQYLIDTPTAALQLASTRQKLARVESQFKALKGELSSTTSKKQNLSSTLSKLENENQQLQQELTDIKRISADAVQLHERHQTLMHDHQIIQTELDVLKAENQRLANDSRNTFFFYGACAVGLGAFIAWIAPSLRRRKRFSEWA